MSYLEKATHLYQMIYSGELLDAFEKYYSDKVVMVESDGSVCEGKEANREREKEFIESVQSFDGGEVLSLASNELAAVTMVESTMSVTFKGGKKVDMQQVAVQYWEGDLIIKERFYYNK
ncbi:SnoaL-like domain-containing protein [Aureibacter tunicatorum]|uniref:Ketosteroid isomerase-like protein n=1 Tax=Aureibacter tunicatorum TaxID=866807 RepID=A0AAE3XPU9_9BACT|nr:SnoaL-like domain-containing protein [Aureibacter tunicatorum]MDR6240932.1 ketosteroid isomerase-like protein [Aureibacter tunicatorum]BDD03712.1 hypothetical protein AUTU_11950 [Aureibacter tunicatorum]